MSDLLARMINRAVRPVRAIMPVVPSLYESTRGPEGFVEPSPVRQAFTAAPASSEPERPASRQRPPAMPHQDIAHPLERIFEAAPPRPRSEDPLERPAQADRPFEPAVTARPDLEPAPESHAPARPESWPAPSPEPATRLRELEPVAAAVPHMADFSAPRRPREEAPRTRRQFDAGSPAPQQTVEVHVSIDHIEVRQSAPPATPAPRPAPAPHVRLEDYLKRRGAEGR